MRSLAVQALSVRCLRNLATVDVELGPRFNVLAGDNGQGKTNLLESVYLLATSRSFRTSRLSELLGPDSATASIRARVREADETREQSVGLRSGVRAVRIDGNRVTDRGVTLPPGADHVFQLGSKRFARLKLELKS